MAIENAKDPEETMAEAVTWKDNLSITMEVFKKEGTKEEMTGSVFMQEAVA